MESGSQVALGAREMTVVLVRYGIRAIWDIGYGIAAVRYGIVVRHSSTHIIVIAEGSLVNGM